MVRRRLDWKATGQSIRLTCERDKGKRLEAIPALFFVKDRGFLAHDSGMQSEILKRHTRSIWHMLAFDW